MKCTTQQTTGNVLSASDSMTNYKDSMKKTNKQNFRIE